MFLITLDQLHTPIGATIILDDVLHVGIALKQDRPDSPLEISLVIVIGRDNADLGPFGAIGHAVGQRSAAFGPRPTSPVGRRRRKLFNGRAAHGPFPCSRAYSHEFDARSGRVFSSAKICKNTLVYARCNSAFTISSIMLSSVRVTVHS